MMINKDYNKPVKDFFNIEPQDVRQGLIDPVTGDVYRYDFDLKQWEPRLNAGLHNRAVSEMNKIGKMMVSREKFRVRPVELEYEAPAGSSNEFVVHIKKVNYSHYLFKDVKNEFLVENPTAWVMHPICFLNPKNAYDILAESNFSPEIIEVGLNIGCLFYIGKKYPASLKILDNYIQKILYQIRFGGHKKISVFVKIFYFLTSFRKVILALKMLP